MLQIDLPIPTEFGWCLLSELALGDKVYGPDGRLTPVVAISAIRTAHDIYELGFDDGAQFLTSAEHLWVVERKTRRRVAGSSSQGLDRRQYRERVRITVREIGAHDHHWDNRLAIPINAPLVMPDAVLPVPPYTLGAWLGDGHSNSARLTCAYADYEIVEAVRAEGVRVAEVASSNQASGLYSLDCGQRGRKGTGMTTVLRSLGLLHNKHIPLLYQRGATVQRLELLRGLMDTDGHCNTRGTATFVNSNERLADDVFDLAAGLGLKPSKYAYFGAKKPYWQVAFQAYQALNPFRLSRKANRAKVGARPSPRRYIIGCSRIGSALVRTVKLQREDGLFLVGHHMVATHDMA
ncbi:MAG TPA: LAGLIDADG family homing endonuclease [Aromatoleum sp.]|uniref:LAGLIDADG family homing endonuclease n=1 Tax=Aromatoleum sp. TaxID=2307007 RepID=UPI002B4924FA|nr:LAGLIDADG family homing endonuclease [Aromatoleum sp.]HJV26314.1 LAGLIDADG family homing endonuclease [Aromatoleum sp.]